MQVETTIANLRLDVVKFEDKISASNERILFLEKERIPQIETSLRNLQFSVDIQRDALVRIKDHTTLTD